ncbi:type II toxin-antitoxin system PemK/MazF family toxin [Pleurocapsa sp. FMAR1]|uniref:type II toxin-antitoxin system PemK/MazF family toxin n=1 Tax=Pleurocapsa sp. FMAR1 TaxID=3040204 RepID=UPI0029C85503|nr:type II toxin-antitoxin system PemK/MazF family toxin [Pleurocapsa sp. FMAR1]
MKRGDIYLANLNPTIDSEQAGTRPVLIVSRDAINKSSPVVIIVPLTKYANSKRIYPSHHLIKAANNGLTTDSIAKCEQIRAIAKSRLQTKKGSLLTQDMEAIDNL